MKTCKGSMEQLFWKDVRKDVQQVNPALVAAIDAIDPGKAYPVWKVRYPFGCQIIRDGILYIPLGDGDLVPIHASVVPSSMCEALNYTPNMPVGVVLKHTAEMYYLMGEHVISFRVMSPGRIVSLWASLQPSRTSANVGGIWQVSAGARSLMMLPKISQLGGYRKLQRKFKVHTAMPSTSLDQWPLLSELYNAPEFQQPWYTEMLFLTRPWLVALNGNDVAWNALKLFLLEAAWKDTNFLRNQEGFNYVISRAIVDSGLKPNPYLTDVVKYLYMIGMGNYTGFKIASNDSAGPVARFQEIFMDVYGLKYSPTMCHAGIFNSKDALDPVYYSLTSPNLIVFSPRSRKASNKLDDLREIKHIQDRIKQYILEDSLQIQDAPIYQLMHKVDYGYYHSEHDPFREVSDTMELVYQDKSLLQEVKRYPDHPFCHVSPILRGCVRIAVKRTGMHYEIGQ